MNTPVLGVDVSMKTLDLAAVVDDELYPLCRVPNNAGGWKQILTILSERWPSYAPTNWTMCLEPSGRYEMGVAVWAHGPFGRVCLPNPKHVRDWIHGCGGRAKTDRIDANNLALFAAERKAHTWHPSAAEVRELDSLLRRKEQLKEMIRAEKNRRELSSYVPDVHGAVRDNMDQVLKSLEQWLDEIEEAIKKLSKGQQSVAQKITHMRTVPGVGADLVGWLFVHFSNWFAKSEGKANHKVVAASVGIDPRTHESGTSVRGPRSISRMGNAILRSKLYAAVLGGAKHDNPLRAFMQSLLKRGKAYKVARVAAAHKILTWAWLVFCTDTDFDPALHAASS